MSFPKYLVGFTVAACFSVGAVDHVFAQDAPPAVEEAKPKAPELPPVPETLDQATVSSYIETLNSIRPTEQSRDAVVALVQALSGRMDELLTKKLDDESVQESVGFRFALYGISGQLGIPETAEKKTAWIAALKASDRPVVATMGTGLAIMEATQSQDAATGNADAWKSIFQATLKLLQDTKSSPFAANVAMQISEMSELAAPSDLAAKAHLVFAKQFEQSDDENIRGAAEMLAGVGRRLSLPGNEMIVDGTTLDGKPFALTQLKGKVVVVDFWATWCGYCIESFPALEKLYTEHKAAGLEIVGVNIDDTKELWTEYLASKPLPWTHIQNLGTSELNRHPNANRYAINAIPFMALIGRDGKVVQINVSPEELETLIPAELAK